MTTGDWVTARKFDGVIDIEVASTGCELNEQQVAHVFDRFWRADPSRKDASLHVGLGLAIVHRIITSLGGTVEADAQTGSSLSAFAYWSPPLVEAE